MIRTSLLTQGSLYQKVWYRSDRPGMFSGLTFTISRPCLVDASSSQRRAFGLSSAMSGLPARDPRLIVCDNLNVLSPMFTATETLRAILA